MLCLPLVDGQSHILRMVSHRVCCHRAMVMGPYNKCFDIYATTLFFVALLVGAAYSLPCGYTSSSCTNYTERLPNPQNCRTHFWCVGGEWILQPCQPGLECTQHDIPYCKQTDCTETEKPTPTLSTTTAGVSPPSVDDSSTLSPPPDPAAGLKSSNTGVDGGVVAAIIIIILILILCLIFGILWWKRRDWLLSIWNRIRKRSPDTSNFDAPKSEEYAYSPNHVESNAVKVLVKNNSLYKPGDEDGYYNSQVEYDEPFYDTLEPPDEYAYVRNARDGDKTAHNAHVQNGRAPPGERSAYYSAVPVGAGVDIDYETPVSRGGDSQTLTADDREQGHDSHMAENEYDAAGDFAGEQTNPKADHPHENPVSNPPYSLASYPSHSVPNDPPYSLASDPPYSLANDASTSKGDDPSYSLASDPSNGN